MRTTSLSAALAALAFAACIPPNDDPGPELRRALPTAADVRIELPQTAAKPGAADAVGDLASWYVATRNLTRDLNAGTAWVLILVHTIVQYPATSIDGDTYTWGPWGNGLDPARYRLVVTANPDGSYGWTLDGDSNLDDVDAFETVIAGTATPGAVEGEGHGDFAIDFDAGERVNPIDNQARGTVAVVYDLAARHLDLAIDRLADDGVTPVHADYAYQGSADGGGDMVFEVTGDTEDPGALPEDAVVRSRWLATGDGRADVRLSSGDLGDAQVTGSQCWDTHFLEVFYSDSADFLPTSGVESDCAFATSDLPPL